MYHLYYLAKPIYGGWVSFTAHLALKHSLPIYKVGSRTESKQRPYGYGATYRNVGISDLPSTPIVITAIDKNYYDILQHFPDGTYVVIHDPSEVTKKTSHILLEQLRRFRIITIRESVQTYLRTNYGLESRCFLHPFYAYPYERTECPTKAVSISRIDYDKHTGIILEANRKLEKPIELHGAVNLRYVFHKLDDTEFKAAYRGKFDKTFAALSSILKDTKWVVDMSVIKADGGGSQYCFLEAIHHGCALVLNSRWIEGRPTQFVHGQNCYVVKDGEELLGVLEIEDVSGVVERAKALLQPHIDVDWLALMTAMDPPK